MADKIVQLVDKNSNNLYPVAGAVIDNAVSTGAISSQAVTNAKIENGAVNGVANDATAIGTAKLALDTVGTPNLRDASVTSDKIDFTTTGPDANGWYMIKISDSIAIWTQRKTRTGIVFAANNFGWRNDLAINQPVDLINKIGGTANAVAGNPAVGMFAWTDNAPLGAAVYFSNRSPNQITTEVIIEATIIGTYQ